jgi:hypothetical protein
MKEDSSSMMEAVRLASRFGLAGLAGLMGEERWRDGLDQELVEAARRGDHAGVRKLLGVEERDLQIGDVIPDGTVYAGILPDTGKRLFVALGGFAHFIKFKDAEWWANMITAHGHSDWRLPTRGELNLLFNNRAAIGGFPTERSSGSARYLWSSTARLDDPTLVWALDFTRGEGTWAHTSNVMSSRVVRAEP